MRIVLLGGNGFIGANLCEVLFAKGHNVRVFDRPRKSHVCSKDVVDQIEWFEGDFLNPLDVRNALQNCDLVFHLVSTTIPKTSNDNLVYDVESNVVATIRMLEEAVKCNIQKVIFISSGGTVYGIPKKLPITESHNTDPICGYGIGKLIIEKYLSYFHYHYGLDYTIFRLSNPYGQYQNPDASQGVITVFLNKALNGEAIEIWGDGSVTRDYIYINDAVDAMVQMLGHQGDERIFNLGSGEGKSINEIINAIQQLVGHHVKRSYVQGRPLDVPVNVLDITRIGRTIGWVPVTSLGDGLRQTLEYLQSR